MRSFRLFVLFVVVGALMLTACGGGGGEQTNIEVQATPVVEQSSEQAAEPTPEPEPTAEPTAEPTPEPTNAVTSLDGVRSAVVQIVAQGSFLDPEFGLQMNAAGSGSGFIIDESGIAVTNNHVVTGAALLKVYIGGEDEPRNARILGVSECSDLAVIDIDGDDFPYLEWYDGDINVGLDVYAAGFPLGDPEFTLTRGIVSKARADGETSWASVDSVLEHDATINPGNSGGPLVDANGRIVGVNYAGASSTNQYFAIAQAEALPVIEQLRAGSDVTSIGINGTAVADGGGLSGIWVSSVKSGSVADQVGVEMGDIVTQLEGLVLATDGTMSDYCDILRTHGADDVMAIEVLRYASEEVLAGQLNGDELEQTFSFAVALEEEVADTSSTGGTSGATYFDYTYVYDDSGQLEVEVPVEWSDINGSAWTSDGEPIGIAVSASPNLDDFWGTWTTPGVFFAASDSLTLTEQELLDVFTYNDSCTYEGRSEYDDGLYTGYYDLWADCGGSDSIYIVLSASPEARDFIIMVTVQVVSDADLDALDRILNSFVVITD
ncbi:MAG: trypsin-like peptidase domain-containing protein [Anaerolineales bacterium]|nr:trypsin-like peptidase domain-containing protein [Anaerolineales bacterium]